MSRVITIELDVYLCVMRSVSMVDYAYYNSSNSEIECRPMSAYIFEYDSQQ